MTKYSLSVINLCQMSISAKCEQNRRKTSETGTGAALYPGKKELERTGTGTPLPLLHYTTYCPYPTTSLFIFSFNLLSFTLLKKSLKFSRGFQPANSPLLNTPLAMSFLFC